MPMTPARTIAGQGDGRHERQRLHHVVRALGRPAEVDVERADEELAGVLDGVDRLLEPLDRCPARRRTMSPWTSKSGRSSGSEGVAVRGEARRTSGDPAAERDDAVEEVVVARPTAERDRSSASISRSIVLDLARGSRQRPRRRAPVMNAPASSRPRSRSSRSCSSKSSIAASGPSWTVTTRLRPTTTSRSRRTRLSSPSSGSSASRVRTIRSGRRTTRGRRLLVGRSWPRSRRLEGDGSGDGVEVGVVALVDVDPEQRPIVDLPGLDRRRCRRPGRRRARRTAARGSSPEQGQDACGDDREEGQTDLDHAHRAVLGCRRRGGRRLDSDHWTLRRRTLCGSSRARAGGRRRAGVWCGVDAAEHRAAPAAIRARERAVGIVSRSFHAWPSAGPGALRHPCKESAPGAGRLRRRTVGTVFAVASRPPSRKAGVRSGHAPEVPHDQANRSCPCPHRRHRGVLAGRDAQPHDRAAPVDASRLSSPGRVAVVLLGRTPTNRTTPEAPARGSFSVRINAMRRRRL